MRERKGKGGRGQIHNEIEEINRISLRKVSIMEVRIILEMEISKRM